MPAPAPAPGPAVERRGWPTASAVSAGASEPAAEATEEIVEELSDLTRRSLRPRLLLRLWPWLVLWLLRGGRLGAGGACSRGNEVVPACAGDGETVHMPSMWVLICFTLVFVCLRCEVRRGNTTQAQAQAHSFTCNRKGAALRRFCLLLVGFVLLNMVGEMETQEEEAEKEAAARGCSEMPLPHPPSLSSSNESMPFVLYVYV